MLALHSNDFSLLRTKLTKSENTTKFTKLHSRPQTSSRASRLEGSGKLHIESGYRDFKPHARLTKSRFDKALDFALRKAGKGSGFSLKAQQNARRK